MIQTLYWVESAQMWRVRKRASRRMPSRAPRGRGPMKLHLQSSSRSQAGVGIVASAAFAWQEPVAPTINAVAAQEGKRGINSGRRGGRRLSMAIPGGTVSPSTRDRSRPDVCMRHPGRVGSLGTTATRRHRAGAAGAQGPVTGGSGTRCWPDGTYSVTEVSTSD